MLYEEREKNLIDAFSCLSAEEMFLIPESSNVKGICSSLRNPTAKCNWIDSSGKGDPPPDFYNDAEMLMLEVMRVDDHGFQHGKKTKNENLHRQHEIEKELRKKMGEVIKDVDLIINAVTELPTSEDHNYSFYYNNFKRTVENHIKNIENYKRNHPDHAVVFFVYDESSAYFECQRKTAVCSRQGDAGRPHFWFLDKLFLDVFLNTEIDYLIWFTPYKWFERLEPPCDLPKACIFDCNNFPYENEAIEYCKDFMASSEE